MFNIPKLNLNKNLLMFITSAIYIIGISGGFINHPIIVSIIITAILLTLCVFNTFKVKYIFIWLLIFYFGLYSAIFRISETDILYNIAPKEATITGKLISIPNSSLETNSKFFFKVNSIEYENKKLENINAKVLVNLKAEDINKFKILKVSNTYKISGNLRKPFKASNPSQFDYGKYLRNYDAHTVFYATIDTVVQLDSQLTLYEKFFQKLNILRGEIIKTHSKYLKSPNLELLGGIVFGDDAVAPPENIKTSFINSGLLHILAASGMNVAFIYGFWFLIAGWLKLPYKLRIAGGIPIIITYSLMTGLGASVVRATIMIIFVLLGKLIDRDAHSIALLSLVAFLMLLINPSYINDVGFQLSFIVTFGILITSPLIIKFGESSPKVTFKESVLNLTSGIIFIPIIAQIWVMPIQMYYFNTISVYSVFANILTVPFLSIVSFAGFISSILEPIKYIGEYICLILDKLINPFLTIIVNISQVFASLPNSLIFTKHPNFFQIITYYLIIISIIHLIRYKIFNKKTLIPLTIIIALFASSFFSLSNKDFEVIFFDVQNADCILAKTPQNKYFMIDTGKSGYDKGKSQAEFLVTKYMKDNGIKNLEFIIVTHFDNDHSGGAVDLMKYANTKTIYLNSKTSDTFTGYNIFKYLKNHPETTIKYAKNNELIYSEPNFEITNYFANLGSDEDNENSIITFIKHHNNNFLFTGDAGVTAFNKLPELPSNITLLKVPHHGADGVLNKEIITKFSPKYAILSVGKNIYGHPSSDTLNLLNNSIIYRTDINNAIKISSGENYFKAFNWDIKQRKFIELK